MERTTVRRIRYEPNHPLTSSGYISEARAALFDQVGWGPHPCRWCGKSVDWKLGVKGNPHDALVADHLNHDPLDDRAENLVVACGSCNVSRRKDRVQDSELFIQRGTSRVRAIERECEACGETFLIAPAGTARGRGRFCSRSCARRAPRTKQSPKL